MKRLLFVLAFTFIGGQAFSQMYIMVVNAVGSASGPSNPITCGSNEIPILIVEPNGTETYNCIPDNISNGQLGALNVEINNILNLGYKLIETYVPKKSYSGSGNTTTTQNFIDSYGVYEVRAETVFLFAMPWNSSGLEEASTTLKSFIISPNPANTVVDISLDCNINREFQVTFINEAGYIYQQQTLKGMSKNEKYNVDISKLPPGKYLVTIVNGKTYTTPQKLIVL